MKQDVLKDVELQYKKLLEPSDRLIDDIGRIKGDILILGVGGKMGPALATLAKSAIEKSGCKKRVIGVSRFSEPGLEATLNGIGIETIVSDLLEDEQLQRLPEVENVLFLAGTKFGTSGRESFTWAMNTYLPGRVAEKYKNANIVAFSTGNVYHLSPVALGGAVESKAPNPFGEYAQSCLGRERIFEYASNKYQTPLLIYRLNYANDIGYGVLLEIAKSVKNGLPVDLSMGNVNVIWQADANEIAIRSLLHCSTPPKILNVTGPETLSVRWVAEEFGYMLAKKPIFVNAEQPDALLSNAAESFRLFGYPNTPVKKIMELLASWIHNDGKTIGKPTHFQERNGQF